MYIFKEASSRDAQSTSNKPVVNGDSDCIRLICCVCVWKLQVSVAYDGVMNSVSSQKHTPVDQQSALGVNSRMFL